MNLRSILVAILMSLLISASASAEPPSASPLHTFYGEVKAIDLKAKTLTLKSNGRSFLFQITDETRISSPHGYVSWDKVRPGQGATVVMRLGEGNKGIALQVRFDADASRARYLSLYSAKTVHGEIIWGIAINNYVVSEPPEDAWVTGITYELKYISMFVLSVRPDGTVAEARPIRGLGYPELDARAAKWLKKWRFRPNSFTEVRMPFGYTQTRYR